MTVDLATGARYDPRPEDHFTRRTACRADPGVAIPLWRAFLGRVTGGDAELEAYLQRVAGYCCTGHVWEHALFFLLGSGANGKTVFAGTLAGILGDYAVALPPELLVAAPRQPHPVALAHLRGARLAVAGETEAAARWPEVAIKRLTGGDRIAARFGHGDVFEFAPQFKIMIAGNHVPQLAHVDEAIRRRLHVVPFAVTIPVPDRDIRLFEKLKAEWPGILAWMVEGSLAWRARGLCPPDAVTRTTAEYLQAEDSLAQWLAESCRPVGAAFETTADLYASFRAWSETAGEPAPSMKRFAATLKARGYEAGRARTGRQGFKGLRLAPPEAERPVRAAGDEG